MTNGQMDNGQADETDTPVVVNPEDTPVVESPEIKGADDWREKVLAEHSGEAGDLRDFDESFGSVKALLRAVFEAADANQHLQRVKLAFDDQIMLDAAEELGYAVRDELTDKLGVTTTGRSYIGIKPEGYLDLPVEVAEITGNIEENELAARYMEGKVRAIDRALTMHQAPQAMMTMTWEEHYSLMAMTLKAAAKEFRMGLHTPSDVIEGRVIPYNEDRSTGISHARAITLLCEDIHGRNVKAGWWHDLHTGEKLDRNPGELIALCHSELSEALEGVRKNRMDDHLPHRKMEEVEMADCVIRIADYCGGRGLDLGGAIDEKLAYNATRADHKPENRLKDDGKKM